MHRSIAICFLLAACTVKTPLVERLVLDEATGKYSTWHGEGVIYALPKTAFDVRVQVSRTDLEVPRCAADSVSDEDWKTLELDKNVVQPSGGTVFAVHSGSIAARSVPDATQVFLSRTPTSGGDAALKVTMGESGLANGTEASAKSKTVETVAKVLEVAGSVAGGLVAFGAAAPQMTSDECREKVQQYAELARELSSYRSAPSPYPKDTLEQYYNEIKAEQAAIQALFVGKPTVTKGVVACEVVPQAEGENPVLTLYWHGGLAVPAGVQCQMDKRLQAPAGVAGPRAELVLNVKVVDNTLSHAYAARSGTVAVQDAGFYYRVPARALVSLSGHPKATTEPTAYLVAQLGSVEALPRISGSHPSLNVELYAETGALKSVQISHESADMAGLIGSAGTGAGAVVSALSDRKAKADAARKEAEANRDPLVTSTYQKNLIETELAIATAKKALADLQSTQGGSQ